MKYVLFIIIKFKAHNIRNHEIHTVDNVVDLLSRTCLINLMYHNGQMVVRRSEAYLNLTMSYFIQITARRRPFSRHANYTSNI